MNKCSACGIQIDRQRKKSNLKCLSCKQVIAKKRYSENRQRLIEYAKRRRSDNGEKIKARKRELYKTKNREKIINCVKVYYLKNRDKVLERKKILRKQPATIERIRERNRMRKTMIRALEKYTDITIDFLLQLKRQTQKCKLCNCVLTESIGDQQRHLDHIIPLFIGGKHIASNVRYVCRKCNLTRPKDGSDNQKN